MKDILLKLNQQEKEIIELYTDKKNYLIGDEYDCLYIQSFKDCIKFLKFIEVF